jgi:hypothetical protein
MNEPRTRPAGTCQERCARWLGVDDNPLRRPADRVEAWLRLLMLALVLTAVPVIAIGCGLVANQVLAHRAQARQHSDHLVSAVLTNQAPGDLMGLYPADPGSWVQARWTAQPGRMPEPRSRSGSTTQVRPSTRHPGVRTW